MRVVFLVDVSLGFVAIPLSAVLFILVLICVVRRPGISFDWVVIVGFEYFRFASAFVEDDGAIVQTADIAFPILILLLLDGNELGLDLFFLFN